MKKKFAFLLIGEHYDPAVHHAAFDTQRQVTLIVTVKNYQEARQKVLELQEQGVGAIELCGGFGPDRARELGELTGHQVAIGFVTHHRDQDDLFQSFFTNFG